MLKLGQGEYLEQRLRASFEPEKMDNMYDFKPFIWALHLIILPRLREGSILS